MDLEDILETLDELDLEQLQTLKNAIEKTERKAKKRSIAAVKAEVDALLAAKGLSLEDLAAAPSKARSSGAKLPPKYRDTQDAENVWTGRGRAPKWMQAYLDAGRSKVEFLISAE